MFGRRFEMAVEIIPLSETLGAEIRGVDLAVPLDEPTAAALRDAWHCHVLLLFRDQELDDAGLRESAAWLGEAGRISMPVERRGDDDTSIALVSNILDDAGAPIGALGDGEMWFHHDNCFEPEPDKATFLYAVELPSAGGHTLFGNCYVAWETLPDELRAALAVREILQVYDYTVREAPDLDRLDQVRHCWQPAAVRHPVTGRTALYVDRLMTAAVSGYEREESYALLAQVFPYVERADYEHVWRLGDYVIWDNRCSVHARTDFNPAERRLLKRGKIDGEALISAG
jgi:taurine dioxygenase